MTSKKKVVYLFLNKETNYIKIGVTKDVVNRKRTLERQSGCKLTVLFTSHYINQSFLVESSFKKYFRLAKTEGEYFNIPQDAALNTLQYILQNLYTIHAENL